MDNLEIEGLEPATDYIMYSVLKGTPADPSPLYINRFRTKRLSTTNYYKYTCIK